ncbi:MAG: L-threonylcarbamoyladenylate synthase [Candidatus Azotimanducaceae bacterium]|jgi:L-threonylcarbamoyladenylate synthase
MRLELRNSLDSLNRGKTILYPTDTVWGIGCDATDIDAVSKVYSIKNRQESKSVIILVSSIHMLKKHVSVSKQVLAFLNTTVKPTTVIYKNPKGIAKNIIGTDNTVAIRIVQDDFCRKLIKKLGRPIVSTSANVSGDFTPSSFDKIQKSILESVDYVVNLHHKKVNTEPSSIIKIEEDGSIHIIRN